jgi:hypothetical protein
MLDRSISVYQGRKLLPSHKPDTADETRFNLAPNTRYRRGQLVGQATGTVNDVQTITSTGGATSGSVDLLVRDPRSGGWGLVNLPWNASAATALGAFVAVLGPNVAVTGGPLNTTPLVVTASGSFVGMPLHLMTLEVNSLEGGASPTVAIVHTTAGRTKATVGLYPTVSPALAICSYEVTTDSSGNAIMGPLMPEGYNGGETQRDALFYIAGYFWTKHLIGLDQDAIDDGFCRLVSGTLADGEIRVR